MFFINFVVSKTFGWKKNGFPNPKGAGLNITYASHCTFHHT